MTSRNHHYLPQFYLKGFTQDKSKKSQITVLDLLDKRIFKTNPRNVGGIRDFNRVETANFPLDVVEHSLSGFETLAAEAIRDVKNISHFTKKTLNVILNLIALLAIRSPRNREKVRKSFEDLTESSLGSSLSSKSRWELIAERMQKEGHIIPHDISYDELKAFYNRKEYRVELDNTYIVDLELRMIDPVLTVLANRNWTLMKSISKDANFITTDNPVVLTWIRPSEIPLAFQNAIGFGLKNTQVLFPITKELLLIGEFDGFSGTVSATAEDVAKANSVLLQYAAKQIYASTNEFSFMTNEGIILTGNDYFSFYDGIIEDK